MNESTIEDDHISNNDDHSVRSGVGSPPGSSQGYWNSEEGKRTSSALPKSAPPLDFRNLDWSVSKDADDNFVVGEGSGDNLSGRGGNGSKKYAAGSAVQAARVANLDKQ